MTVPTAQMTGSGTARSHGIPLTGHTDSPQNILGAFRTALIVLRLFPPAPAPNRSTNLPPPSAHRSVCPAPGRTANASKARSLHASGQPGVNPGLPPRPHKAPHPRVRPPPFPPPVAPPLRCSALERAGRRDPRSALRALRLTPESNSGPTCTPPHLDSQFLPII